MSEIDQPGDRSIVIDERDWYRTEYHRLLKENQQLRTELAAARASLAVYRARKRWTYG